MKPSRGTLRRSALALGPLYALHLNGILNRANLNEIRQVRGSVIRLGDIMSGKLLNNTNTENLGASFNFVHHLSLHCLPYRGCFRVSGHVKLVSCRVEESKYLEIETIRRHG